MYNSVLFKMLFLVYLIKSIKIKPIANINIEPT